MTSSELRPFVVPYKQVIAGSICVLASHALAWAVWKQVVGIPFAPWIGLVQAAYVVPFYFRVSRRWSYVGLGVKRAGQ